MTNTTKALRDAREALARLAEPLRPGSASVMSVARLRISIATDALSRLDAALAHQAEHAEAGEAVAYFVDWPNQSGGHSRVFYDGAPKSLVATDSHGKARVTPLFARPTPSPKPINEDMLVCLIASALAGAYAAPERSADSAWVEQLAKDCIKQARKFS